MEIQADNVNKLTNATLKLVLELKFLKKLQFMKATKPDIYKHCCTARIALQIALYIAPQIYSTNKFNK